MRAWTPILVLCLVVATAPPARAAVLYKGFTFTPLGGCALDVDQNGGLDRLDLTNLGPSGQDGASLACALFDGARLVLAGATSPADSGAVVALDYHWTLAGSPTAVTTRLQFAVSAAQASLTPDCVALSTAPGETVVLSRGGSSIATLQLAAGTPVSVAFDSAGACPNPALACAVVRASGSNTLSCRAGFPSAVTVTVAGQPYVCDDVDFRCAVDPGDAVSGSSCDLLVTAPSGSSFGSVACSDGACRAKAHWLQGSGGAGLAAVSDSSGGHVQICCLSSGGQDGLAVLAPQSGGSVPIADLDGDGAAVALRFSPPGLYFDPVRDAGGAAVITIVGDAFASDGSSLGAASASLQLTMTGSSFYVVPTHTGGGIDQEWVEVLNNGVEVARAQVSQGQPVPVSAPPGGPLGMAIREKGLPGDKPVRGSKGPAERAARPASALSTYTSSSGASGSVVDVSRPLHVVFQSSRLFTVGGSQVAGDELVCWGDNSSGTYAGTFVVASTSELVSAPGPSSSLSSLSLLDVADAGGDPIGPQVGSAVYLSAAQTCTTVPFVFSRTDTTPVRAYSVTFHLSSNLATCGAGVVEGSYLSSVASTQLLVTNRGGGSYTVDCGILGPVCGATGSGTLFSLQLAAAGGATSGTGSIVIDSVKVRDCNNQPVPADAGANGYVPIQLTPPGALAGLAASQRRSGNAPGAATTGVTLSWPATAPATAVAVYRIGFGNYPYYGSGTTPGSVPTAPVSPAAALSNGWALSSVAATGGVDLPSARDFLYYVAFVSDAYGNTSSVSNLTAGTLDYALGDVSDGTTACSGDDHVDIADISLLGSHYGTTVGAGSPYACLDVGPTSDLSVNARPLADGLVDFEDFMMFAINFSVVSAPQAAARPAAAAGDAAQLAAPTTLPPVGGTFDAVVSLDGGGDAQGVRVRLGFDPAVLEQVSVAAGALLDQQGRSSAVLSSGPGDVDAALLGTGPGIAGHGELARVTFRVRAAGDPKLALASVVARDARNQAVAVAGGADGADVATRTGLGIVFPNPFRAAIEIRMSLLRAGSVRLCVYDVAGRRVRTLLQGAQPAGARTVTWDGDDDAGVRMAPGAYVVRLEAGSHSEARAVRLVR